MTFSEWYEKWEIDQRFPFDEYTVSHLATAYYEGRRSGLASAIAYIEEYMNEPIWNQIPPHDHNVAFNTAVQCMARIRAFMEAVP